MRFHNLLILAIAILQGYVVFGINPEKKSIQDLYHLYASGPQLSQPGLRHLLRDLGFKTDRSLQKRIDSGLPVKRSRQVLSEKECLSSQEVLILYQFDTSKSISRDEYLRIVPTILRQTHNPNCEQPILRLSFSESNKQTVEEGNSEEKKSKNIPPMVWVSATIAIIIISMVGLLGVGVVPLVQKSYYNQVLQFLVALAVGALTGDAMLHLLPHAIVESAMEEHEEGEVDEGHDHSEKEIEAVFKGLTALGGIYFFFMAEKIVGLVSEARAEKKAEEEEREKASKSGRKPSNFSDFMMQEKHPEIEPHAGFTRRLSAALMDENTMTIGLSTRALKSIDTLNRYAGSAEGGDMRRGSASLAHRRGSSSLGNRSPALLSVSNQRGSVDHTDNQLKEESEEGGTTEPAVTLVVPSVETKPSTSNDTEKKEEKKEEKKGHGHGHSHDEVPDSVASVAWMVIMGDGLHNFTDGLAIGAAFAKDITGGLSTTIAVFCHELPHELGDFAVLLKTGMAVKQALFYNILSSVLSLVGVYIGVALGNIESTSIWIFAMTAGIFIYIALVDMLPELNMADVQPGESRLAHFAYQCGGIVTGVGIMLLIALFEEDIKTAFGGDEATAVLNSTATTRFYRN